MHHGLPFTRYFRFVGVTITLGLLASCSQTSAKKTQEIAPFTVIRALEVGQAPHGFRVEGETITIALSGDDEIGEFNWKTGEIIKKLPTPNVPLDLIRHNNNWLVSHFSSNEITEISSSNETLNRFSVGQGPSLFTAAPTGHISIVSERADQLTVFEENGLKVISTGQRPYPGHVTSDGVLAFIPNRTDNTVTVYDLLNDKPITHTPVCNTPEGGALTADEVSYMVACGGSNQVMFINTASFEVTHTISDGIGKRPFSVVAGPHNRYAYVNNSGEDTISVIDLTSHSVIKSIKVGTQPIVIRIFDNHLFVTNEVSGTLNVITLPEKPATSTDAKNEVIVLGMIHGGHNTSENYSLAVLEQAFRKINPDYVLTEMPPNRFDKAMQDWQTMGKIDEPRIKRFPEYVGMLFPLLNEMDFTIIPTAGWNTQMNDYRRTALERLSKDPSRAQQWADYQASIAELDKALERYQQDDPLFIHSDTYDTLIKNTYGGPYEQFFNDDLGTGGWATINQAHYSLIEKALDEHQGEGKRFVVTYGAGHKYWILEQLRKRDDITLIDPKVYFSN